MMGLVPLSEETPKSSHFFLSLSFSPPQERPSEDKQDESHLQARKRVLTRHQICHLLDLELLTTLSDG